MDCSAPYWLLALAGGFLAAGVACFLAAVRRARAGGRRMRAELDGERARRVACEQERNRLKDRVRTQWGGP